MSECPICFNSLWLLLTPCKHNICLQCLLKLRKDECPTCRGLFYNQLPIEIQRIMTVYKSESDQIIIIILILIIMRNSLNYIINYNLTT